MTIIERLKKNWYPLGAWLEPECYGPELGKEMQDKAKEIGRNEFEVYWPEEATRTDGWVGQKKKESVCVFVDNMTYHLKSTYKEPEPEYVECKIKEDHGVVVYVDADGDDMPIDMAERHGAIGYRHKGGVIYNSLNAFEDEDGYLWRKMKKDRVPVRATHVVFRTKK